MKFRADLSTFLMTLAAVAAGTFGMMGGAAAHHPMGGEVPSTLWQGLLSGVAHPIIGLDHFAFVIGIGLLAGTAGLGLLMPMAFVAAMASGLGLSVAGHGIPGAEIYVALSVVLIGISIWRRGPGENRKLECAAFAAAGLFHGIALADAAIGAEPTPLAAYIAGLAITQLALAAIVWYLASEGPQGRAWLAPAPLRASGLAIVAVGAVHLVFLSQT